LGLDHPFGFRIFTSSTTCRKSCLKSLSENRLFQRRVIALPKMDQAKNCEGDDEADEQFWGHTYGLTDRHVKYYGVDHIIARPNRAP